VKTIPVASEVNAGDILEHRSSEASFDDHLEVRWRWPSELHWTPVEVCELAARRLAPKAGERVLDVGSGVGKFCVIGARVTPGIFVGVEVRPRLVEQAWAAAAALKAERVSFICSDAFDLDWSVYDCLYLYNPFEEATFAPPYLVDSQLALGDDVRREHVAETSRRLSKLRSGTRVATYHGFGGKMPPRFRRTFKASAGTGELEVWIRK
jgi:SAM-dependent methyltransferase